MFGNLEILIIWYLSIYKTRSFVCKRKFVIETGRS